MVSERIELPDVKIGIDCRSLQQGPAGIATYVGNLTQHIPALDCLGPSRPRNNFLWNQLRVPWAQLRRSWSLYHAPAYTAPLVNLCPLVLMVADISYFMRDEWYPYPVTRSRRLYYRASLYRASRIIVPSRFTGDEIVRLFPRLKERIRCVWLGVSSSFFDPELGLAAEVRRELALPAQYLLHVGDLHPRRNPGLVLEAGRRLDIPVVMVGKVLYGGETWQDQRYLYSGVSLRQLKGIYLGASALVYPSLYEGFGLPLLEAMACGVPVVAASRSCLPEICGDAAILVEPELEPLVEGIRQALSDREAFVARGLRRAHEFTWEKTARKTVEVYRELL